MNTKEQRKARFSLSENPGWKKEVSLQEKKRAERNIRHFLKQFPKKSLIQLLPVIAKYTNSITVQIAIERIERSQSGKLVPDDLIFLEEIKAKLKELKEKPP